MKKRLRRKLGRGEFAHPYPHTKKQRAANLSVAKAFAGLIEEVGIDEFLARVEQHNQASGKALSALYWKDKQVKDHYAKAMTFDVPIDEQPWAYCPTCYYPAYRYQVGQQCPVCDDHFVLNKERAEQEREEEE